MYEVEYMYQSRKKVNMIL